MHLNRIEEASLNELPEIKLNHVHLVDEEMKTTGSRRVTGEANREILVSAAQLEKGTKAKLNDFYELVSVYEAFNGLLQQSSEHDREVFFAEKRRRSIEAGGASAPRNVNRPRRSVDVHIEDSQQPQVSQIQCKKIYKLYLENQKLLKLIHFENFSNSIN